ncbi:restriction endonuclease subunit S [Intestinimonas butyriciproducens]|uniref:restriction endonuclease subunit S n=1 Tax=Intestinimonas butyriciproducens TaxID=1297617 RepID=UPI00068E61E2|nr:restriction endonuclease subunit S [Intestinimonas butyriciproducens]
MVKEMKKTSLGLLPNDWKLDILEHCLKIQTGTRNTEDKKENGKYPFFVRSSKVEHIDTYHYDCEAVLTAGDGVGTGKVFHYINGKFDAHQRVYILTDFDGIEGKYFYYYFRENFLKEVSKYTAKSSVDSVRRDMIAKMVVPIPKLEEQAAIAESLSDVDNLIFSLQKLIEKKKAIKQGAVQKLLTGKKRLPGFNEEWEELNFAESAKLKARIGWQGLTTSEYLQSGFAYLITGTDFHSGRIKWDTCHFVDEKRYKQDLNIQIKKHDILLTKDGTIGKVAYISDIQKPTTLNSGVFVIRPAKENSFDPNFVYHVLNSFIFDNFLAKLSAGSTINHLYQKDFVGFTFKAPSELVEQQAIAQVLSDMDSEIEKLEKKLAKYQQIKQGMMQELLIGRIRLVDADDKEQPKTQILQEKQSQPAHNQHFDDAVMIAGIVNAFYSEKYPLGRKKVQKLLYLVRRKEQADISAFHKKAAGPYADEVRYKGGEPIAQKNKYILVKRNEKGSRFEKGAQMQRALAYLQDWGKQTDIDWLVSQFQYTNVNDLELFATVDMAICDLKQEGKEISVASIKGLIRSNKEWRDKLKKAYFKDADIQRAIKKCQDLFES